MARMYTLSSAHGFSQPGMLLTLEMKGSNGSLRKATGAWFYHTRCSTSTSDKLNTWYWEWWLYT